MFESKMVWFYIVLAIGGISILWYVFHKKEFVESAKVWRSWLSTKLVALGAFLGGFALISPESAYQVFAMIPPDIREYIPARFLSVISTVLFIAAWVSTMVKQKKVQEKLEKKLQKESTKTGV